jgi:hypothetical protein
MINEFEKNMEEIFDIEIQDEKDTECIPRKNQLEDVGDTDEDYSYTRGQLYNLISKGQEAVQGALEVAQESGHPRAYEVAVNAMKQVSDMTDKLIDLQKKMKDLDAPVKGAAPTTVNNTMFVGSTADLQKMIKEMGKTLPEDK